MNEELTVAIDELRTTSSETNWFIPVLINETHILSRQISGVEKLSGYRQLDCMKIGVEELQ
jgi:hypothetical protein